jgi:ABC-type Fe3+/spermidine/putrescine transport system ATPase subunit
MSLDVAAAESLVLMGPPGAGQAALLRVVAGLERPDGGDFLLAGRPMLRTPAAQRGIGLALADQPIPPATTLTAAVAAPLRAGGMAREAAAAAASAALALLGLAGREAERAGALGPTDLALLALARAAAGRPALVLLEEPFAGLDRASRTALQTKWQAVRHMLGAACLHVTTDEIEALRLADRIGVLAKGALRQIGTPEQLYDAPDDAFVARFLGEHNMLRGRTLEIEDDLARIRLECGPMVGARLADALPGQSCLVAIRPERVAVASVAAAEMGEGALPARLTETRFMGDHIRLTLEVGLPGRPPAVLLVKRPAGVPGLRPGEASVAWRAYDAWAFAPVPGVY